MSQWVMTKVTLGLCVSYNLNLVTQLKRNSHGSQTSQLLSYYTTQAGGLHSPWGVMSMLWLEEALRSVIYVLVMVAKEIEYNRKRDKNGMLFKVENNQKRLALYFSDKTVKVAINHWQYSISFLIP